MGVAVWVVLTNSLVLMRSELKQNNSSIV